jgi:DNA-binding response OmpR family regulator
MLLSSGEEPQAVGDLGPPAAGNLGPKSMMIVEDEALVSLMIEVFAAELGWQIAGTAYSEATALELVERIRPAVAVIDINLGSTTGFSVAAECHLRGVPVLFVTGFTAENVPKECGDDPVLPKPFSSEEFDRALSRCVAAPALRTAWPDGYAESG